MVREANVKQATSEKQLKEAWGKVRPISVWLGQPVAPFIALAGGYYSQLARACNKSLSDPPDIRNRRTQVWGR